MLQTLKQYNSRLENRTQLVTLSHVRMGPKVFINCAGFIKIDTKALAERLVAYLCVWANNVLSSLWGKAVLCCTFAKFSASIHKPLLVYIVLLFSRKFNDTRLLIVKVAVENLYLEYCAIKCLWGLLLSKISVLLVV